MTRAGSPSPAQTFITAGRDRPGEVEVDDVRQELDKDGGGGQGGRVAFEDDGWFNPLMVRRRGGSGEGGGEGEGQGPGWGEGRAGLVGFFVFCDGGELPRA